MNTRSPKFRLQWWLAPAIGTIVSLLIWLYVASHKPAASAIVRVAACKPIPPGMRRVGEKSGFQFDVDKQNVSVREGTVDAYPLIHSFSIKPRDTNSVLNISFNRPDAR